MGTTALTQKPKPEFGPDPEWDEIYQEPRQYVAPQQCVNDNLISPLLMVHHCSDFSYLIGFESFWFDPPGDLVVMTGNVRVHLPVAATSKGNRG